MPSIRTTLPAAKQAAPTEEEMKQVTVGIGLYECVSQQREITAPQWQAEAVPPYAPTKSDRP